MQACTEWAIKKGCIEMGADALPPIASPLLPTKNLLFEEVNRVVKLIKNLN